MDLAALISAGIASHGVGWVAYELSSPYVRKSN